MEAMTRDVKERGMIDGGSWRWWWWCGCGWGGKMTGNLVKVSNTAIIIFFFYYDFLTCLLFLF